eukprot:TRINITY_DN14481_c0_g1_i1.p2 TRINITY_DN14481_c0_g1~~TRINITY_DN14481_c0_g1_i1.p2  ORF type:complete len:143 (+),score=24.10 TRINITY_DN14481_c0_g1_i1:48-431(+)
MADSEAFSRLVRAVTSTGYLACVGPSSPQFGWAVSRVEAGDGFQLRCIVHWLVHAMDARFFAWVFSADGAGCSRRHFQLRTGTAECRSRTADNKGRTGTSAPTRRCSQAGSSSLRESWPICGTGARR